MSSQILTLIIFILAAEPLWAASRSRESSTKTEIEFTNGLSAPVLIYWVNQQGTEILYGDLNPGSTRVAQTYATHVWRIRYKDTGQHINTYEAAPERLAIQITEAARPSQPAAKPPTPQTQAQSQRQPLPGLPGIRTPAQTTYSFTFDDYLLMALFLIIGCGFLYGIFLAVKTPSPFVIGSWSTLIENFQASPKEFYVSVERAIASRQVPDINKSRVDWKEGGLLTAFREYLRISREKLVFDICAAPYGTGFFISWWLAELKPSAIGPTLVMIVVVVLLYDRLAFYFGFAAASLYTLIGLILIVFYLGILVNRSPGANWVRYVLVIPLIGKMIERFFMPPTYYRMDTEAMFKASIEQSVNEVVKQMLQAKGLRALTELELKPIMRDFFRR